MNEVSKQLGIKPGETTPNYKFSLERVACFGSCALSPVVVMDGKVYGRMNSQKANERRQRHDSEHLNLGTTLTLYVWFA